MQHIVIMTSRTDPLRDAYWIVNGVGRKGVNLLLLIQCSVTNVDWLLLSATDMSNCSFFDPSASFGYFPPISPHLAHITSSQSPSFTLTICHSLSLLLHGPHSRNFL